MSGSLYSREFPLRGGFLYIEKGLNIERMFSAVSYYRSLNMQYKQIGEISLSWSYFCNATI